MLSMSGNLPVAGNFVLACRRHQLAQLPRERARARARARARQSESERERTQASEGVSERESRRERASE